MLKPPSSSEPALLFSDLDSTLIYSHRHGHDESCIWVEELRGKQQSFMTAGTYRFFTEQCSLRVVPVTTRDHAQYARLSGLAEAMDWEHALICNGAVLLSGEAEDTLWHEDSERLSAPDQPYLTKLRQLAENKDGSEAVIRSDPFMFYVRAENADETYPLLKAAADPDHIAVYRDSRKVYCIPRSLSKGRAVRRYCSRFGYDSFMAAGDSRFDISMLVAASEAFCPEALAPHVHTNGKLHICIGRFSDSLCCAIEKITTEEKHP